LGLDLRIDYFLPDAPEERWSVGWVDGGTHNVGSYSKLEPRFNDINPLGDIVIRNESDLANGLLRAFYSAIAGPLKVEKTRAF
jgi:hypothetical protein